jgi:hypothetical protein
MESIVFKQVLQDMPPGIYFNVHEAFYEAHAGMAGDKRILSVSTPALQLYCDSQNCNGVRLFEYNLFPMHYEYCSIQGGDTAYDNVYVEYLCQNCKENIKSFAIMFISINKEKGTCDLIKMGEFPFYGPHIPSKLISLIGPDKDLFLKGVRCESQKLGIAAFTYYRRVIEHQKDRLIDTLANTLNKLDVDKMALDILELAKKETQFKKSMDNLKPYLPKELLINDTNPIVLLHKSLSIGLHGLTDEICLEYAQSIRIVLTELADRLKFLSSNHNELQSAIKSLHKLQGKSGQKGK